MSTETLTLDEMLDRLGHLARQRSGVYDVQVEMFDRDVKPGYPSRGRERRVAISIAVKPRGR